MLLHEYGRSASSLLLVPPGHGLASELGLVRGIGGGPDVVVAAGVHVLSARVAPHGEVGQAETHHVAVVGGRVEEAVLVHVAAAPHRAAVQAHLQFEKKNQHLKCFNIFI